MKHQNLFASLSLALGLLGMHGAQAQQKAAQLPDFMYQGAAGRERGGRRRQL